MIDSVVDEYHKGDADFHQMVADSKHQSQTAKTVNLGIMYGMGVGKLSHTMDISKDEAKALLAQYHEKVPFVKAWRI